MIGTRSGGSHQRHSCYVRGCVQMYKPSSTLGYLSGKQEYEVDVATGVDTALISAMCVIWDEAVHDNNGNTGFATILG